MKDRKTSWRIFFVRKRQHEKTSNSNVFGQNHKIRKQKKNIERQKISNIKATTKNKKKFETIKKKLKEKIFAKEKNDEIVSK